MVDNTIALRGQSLQAPNLLGMANTAAQTKNTLAQTEIDQSQEQRAQYAGAMQQSRDALAYVNSPEQYLAWHEANHSNRVLGPMLSKMGVTAEQSRAKIMDELQRPGGLESLIQQSAAGADKISGIMQGRLNQMSADRNTAAANARKAKEMAQIDNLFAPTAAPTNNLPPAATAFPVAPPRNTLAATPGSPEAIKNLYAPALANANVAATTPFSASQGGGDAAVMNRVNRLQELYMNGNQEAGRQLKILVDGLKRDKDLGIGVDGGMKPSEQFVPVGKNVFDRETKQFIQPPTPEEVDSIKPTLQKGERWNAEEERVDAVPGTKIYIEQSQKHAKSKQAYDTTNLKVNQMNEKIAEILSDKNANAFAGNFGGYNAYATRMLAGENSNLRKKIESFKSNMKGVGLELIRSGGSIGQMTEKEWPIVEQMLGSIDSVLTVEDARIEFGKIQARINNILDNAAGIYQDEWSNTQYYKPTKGKDNKRTLTGQDAQAAEWANANPNDPRSAEIKRRLGL